MSRSRQPAMNDRGAEAVWDRYAPMIAGMGLLTPVDVPAFAMLCALIAESEQNPRGMTAARISRMESLFGKFGMTPAERAKIGMQKPKSKNAFSELAG
jgi:phage terminase small subunit